jgi:peroxiredoxin
MLDKSERIIITLAISISAIMLIAVVIWRVAFFTPAPQFQTEHFLHEHPSSRPLAENSDELAKTDIELNAGYKTPATQFQTEHFNHEYPPSRPLAENKDELAKTDIELNTNYKSSLTDIIRAARTWQPAYTYWVGKMAPDFTLTDINGKQHKLSNYHGKAVLITFWATWCGPCIREIPHLIALRNLIGDNKLAMLAISNENPALVRQFVANQKINYTVFSVGATDMPAPYNQVRSIPCSFFINPDGKIKLATEGLLSLDETKAILQAPLKANRP